jgi:hypothetical protein
MPELHARQYDPAKAKQQSQVVSRHRIGRVRLSQTRMATSLSSARSRISPWRGTQVSHECIYSGRVIRSPLRFGMERRCERDDLRCWPGPPSMNQTPPAYEQGVVAMMTTQRMAGRPLWLHRLGGQMLESHTRSSGFALALTDSTVEDADWLGRFKPAEPLRL